MNDKFSIPRGRGRDRGRANGGAARVDASIRASRRLVPYPPCRRCYGRIDRHLHYWRSYPLCRNCHREIETARLLFNHQLFDDFRAGKIYYHQLQNKKCSTTREWLIRLGLMQETDICA